MQPTSEVRAPKSDPSAPYTRDVRFDDDRGLAWRDRFGLLRWLPAGQNLNANTN